MPMLYARSNEERESRRERKKQIFIPFTNSTLKCRKQTNKRKKKEREEEEEEENEIR